MNQGERIRPGGWLISSKNYPPTSTSVKVTWVHSVIFDSSANEREMKSYKDG